MARGLIGAVFISAGVLLGCTEAVPPAQVASLRIVPQVDSFFVGRATTAAPFAITLFDPRNAEIRDGRPITYSSSDSTVFSVDARTGAVTGKKIGNGLYRASASGRFVEASVKIIAPVERIQLNTGDFQLNVGVTRQLVPNLVAADGSSISGRLVTYSSSAPQIASVSTGGVVTAVSEGSATITAAVEGKSATLVVSVVREVVTAVRLTPPVAQLMRVGGQLQVTATPLNAANQPLTDRTIAWFTNNPQIVTVSAQGVVSAVGVGNATITAEVESRTATLGITVTEVPVRTVTIEPDTFQLGTGLTRQLLPAVIDSAGKLAALTNRQVLWQSSSSSVATVSAAGVVQGVSGGTARISVTVDGVRSNDAVVQVSPQVVTVRVTPFNPQVLRIGTTVQLSAQALDNNNQPIAGKVANWFSNNPTVASVSASGLVTGLAVGSTTITAEIDSRTASVTVTVTLVPVGSVTFTPALDTLVVGDTKQFNPVVLDTAGRVITSLLGRTVNYASNNNPVATAAAASTGTVVNANAQGTATIVATIDGVASNALTIQARLVTQVTITPSPTATVQVGKTLQLTWTLRDSNGNTLTSTRFPTFSSSNQGVATVSGSGIITGIAAGSATITVNFGGVVATTSLTVNP
jgi:trimeric autotransporter adhesin